MSRIASIGNAPFRAGALLALLAAAYALGATRAVDVATPALAAERAGEPDAATPESIWDDLLAGNRRFVRGAIAPRAVIGRRAKLAAGQQPLVAVLGCSDSRVPPEIVFDQTLGDLFVVRTAGHVADPVALGSLEYAVEHVHVRVLVVLGHEQCGAVKASESGERMPSANLQAIVARIGPSLAKPKAGASPPANANVEANVRRCAETALKESAILERAVKKGELAVIRALYHLESGDVERLP